MKDLKDVVCFRLKWSGSTWSSRVWRWSLRQKLHDKIGSALRWDKTDLEICWICWMLRWRCPSCVICYLMCFCFWITEGGPITLCISQCWSSLPGQGVELDLWSKSIESIESIQVGFKSFRCFHCPFEPVVSSKKNLSQAGSDMRCLAAVPLLDAGGNILAVVSWMRWVADVVFEKSCVVWCVLFFKASFFVSLVSFLKTSFVKQTEACKQVCKLFKLDIHSEYCFSWLLIYRFYILDDMFKNRECCFFFPKSKPFSCNLNQGQVLESPNAITRWSVAALLWATKLRFMKNSFVKSCNLKWYYLTFSHSDWFCSRGQEPQSKSRAIMSFAGCRYWQGLNLCVDWLFAAIPHSPRFRCRLYCQLPGRCLEKR